MICRVSNNCLKVLYLSWSWYGYWCGYVDLVTIAYKFYTYLDLDMDIDADYDMYFDMDIDVDYDM